MHILKYGRYYIYRLDLRLIDQLIEFTHHFSDMSAAGSRHQLESPTGEHADFNEEPEKAALQKLLSSYPPSSRSSIPVIAVDLDDVLSQTNLAVAQCQSFGSQDFSNRFHCDYQGIMTSLGLI